MYRDTTALLYSSHPSFMHAHQNLFQQNKNAFSQHARALTYLLTSFFSLYQPVFSLGDIFL